MQRTADIASILYMHGTSITANSIFHFKRIPTTIYSYKLIDVAFIIYDCPSRLIQDHNIHDQLRQALKASPGVIISGNGLWVCPLHCTHHEQLVQGAKT